MGAADPVAQETGDLVAARGQLPERLGFGERVVSADRFPEAAHVRRVEPLDLRGVECFHLHVIQAPASAAIGLGQILAAGEVELDLSGLVRDHEAQPVNRIDLPADAE